MYVHCPPHSGVTQEWSDGDQYLVHHHHRWPTLQIYITFILHYFCFYSTHLHYIYIYITYLHCIYITLHLHLNYSFTLHLHLHLHYSFTLHLRYITFTFTVHIYRKTESDVINFQGAVPHVPC